MRMTVAKFCTIAHALCIVHGASVTSWTRTHDRNKAKGGGPTSLHLEGLAADLVLDDPTRAPALVKDARARGLDAVDEHDHVHIEADPHHA